MSQTGPGSAHRKGITLLELMDLFTDDDSAERWFASIFQPDSVRCLASDSANGQTWPYRCRQCRKDFSTKTGTLMQGSRLSYRTWAVAIHLLTTSLKGVSSMKLHRDLGIRQATAWHLAHRIREARAERKDPKRRRTRDLRIDAPPEQLVAVIGAATPKAPHEWNYLKPKPVQSDSEAQPQRPSEFSLARP